MVAAAARFLRHAGLRRRGDDTKMTCG
jgi:hypothetical protein